MTRRSDKQEFLREAGEMFDQLQAWREQHADASFDEIAAQVTPYRRRLMGMLLQYLSTQHGDGRYTTQTCPSCCAVMKASGLRKRHVVHPEGDVQLWRSYHYCTVCACGLFTLDQCLRLTNLKMTPETLKAVMAMCELADSYRLAAAQFSALTHVYVSKSSLHRIAQKQSDDPAAQTVGSGGNHSMGANS